MVEILIDEYSASQRFDKFLMRYLPGAGKGFLYRMLRQKKIVRNGAKGNGADILKEGDIITVYFSDDTIEKFSGRKAPEAEPQGSFRKYILYEDADVCIVDKPAGMLTQKAEKDDVSLDDLLVSYLSKKNEIDLKFYRPSAVNRLDRNTSGLVICAKNLKSARTVSALIKKRQIRKEYLCVVLGRFDRDGTYRSASGIDGSRMETRFSCIRSSEEYSLVNAELITGRTHQIRQQLAELDHPIAGDPRYGDRSRNRRLREQYGLKRQYLHAYRLTFPERLPELPDLAGKVIEAGMPKDLPKDLMNAPKR